MKQSHSNRKKFLKELYKKLSWFLLSPTPDARKIRRYIYTAFLLILFIGLFWIIPFEKILKVLSETDFLYFCIGIGWGFVSILLTAIELTILVRRQGIKMGVLQLLIINLVTKFYSLFTPGSFIASGIRWYRLSIKDKKPAEALAALGFFRLVELFLNLIVGLGFWILSGQNSFVINWEIVVSFLIGTVVIWIVLTRFSQPIYLKIKPVFYRLFPFSIRDKIFKPLDKLVVAITTFKDMSVLELVLMVSAGIASIFFGVVSIYFFCLSLKINLSFLDLGWVYSIVLLITQLPFVIAGGLGIREVSMVIMFSQFGIVAELAIAVSLLIFARNIVFSLLGGLVELLGILLRRKNEPLDPLPNEFKGK